MKAKKTARNSAVSRLPANSTRAGEITGAGVGAQVEISFSSELPYFREGEDGGFWEVLGHQENECDLTRLNSGAAPLLKDHMPTLDASIGVVERAWIEKGRGRAVVRFSDTPGGQDVLARVRAGDVTCVSVGYAITAASRSGEIDGFPVIRVTGWTPREISFVAIPADPTVGVGRAAAMVSVSEKGLLMLNDNERDDLENERDDEERDDLEDERDDEERDDEERESDDERDDLPEPGERRARMAARVAVRDAMTIERRRVAEINAISRRFGVSDSRTRRAIERGTSLSAFRAQVMDAMAGSDAERSRASASLVGMSRKEVGRFSLMNAIRYLANPTKATRAAAAFEIEASAAAAQVLRKDPGGLFVPPDVLMAGSFARSKQNTGTETAGGNLVATNLMAGSFIDMLRNRMALTGAGVRILSGLVGNVDIPKQTGGSTAYWIGEDDDVTDSVSTFGLVQLSPHTVGIATPITRRMLKQGTPDVEALVRADLIANAALTIDKAALVGDSSSDAPTGLRAAILSKAVEWAGDNPTFEEIVRLETEVAAENADFGSMSYIYNARMSGHLKTTPIFAPESGRPVEGETGIVNGYARQKSNQVADNEVFFGNWSDLIIGMWSGLDLRVDTATLARSDGLVLRAFQDVDVAVRHNESFCLGKKA